MVKTWCDICYCMRWSCFCKSYRQLAGALWLSLYCMKCKRHVIALLYHYALAIVGKTTTTLQWRWRCQADDDGNHDGALEMEIDTSILHHDFISIFIALWAVTTHYVMILMPFSVILQGLNEEGECRQLGFWAGKGANISDLFCTAPEVLKLHGWCFPNI